MMLLLLKWLRHHWFTRTSGRYFRNFLSTAQFFNIHVSCFLESSLGHEVSDSLKTLTVADGMGNQADGKSP